MRKVNLIFAAVFVVAVIVGGVNMFAAVDQNAVDKNAVDTNVGANNHSPVNIVRNGRRIQVDGFLLEWSGADANVWPGSNWRWDAVSTVDGVAGYVSFNDTAAANWQLTLKAANTGRTLNISLPGKPSGENFAYDKGAFDAGGPLTAEWIVPWDYFDDGEDSATYELTLAASGADGGQLQPLVLTIVVQNEPRGPSGLLTRAGMVAIIAALTVTLIITRRRKMREIRKN